MKRTGTQLKTVAAATLALALLAPFAGQAQSGKPDEHSGHHPPGAAPAPATPPAPGAASSKGMGGGMPGMMMQRPAAVAGLPHMMLHHTEGYLAFLRAELQITTEQASLWSTFADATRTAVSKLRQRTPVPPSSGWPDRLVDSEKVLAAQLEALKTLRPAVGALYAGLTTEQKKKVDELTAVGMGMRM